MNEELIAPCGMNCGICRAYLTYKYDIKSKGIVMTSCIGCRARGKNCAFIKKRCPLIMSGQAQYCYECDDFPCQRLRHLDERYRTRYRMSMVENLEYIKKHGMEKFLEREEAKWKCPQCGGVISCHNGVCFDCGVEKMRNKKYWYGWVDE